MKRAVSNSGSVERLRASLSLNASKASGSRAKRTASDALWAGLPLITLQGTHFASRVASSLLRAIGLPELITESLDDYETLAVRLARDRDALRAFRERLARNRTTEPLFDTARFTRGLEDAYRQMWDLYRAGEAPRRIEAVDTAPL